MAGQGIPGGFDAGWHEVYPAGIRVSRSELGQIVVSRQHGVGRPHDAAEAGQAAVALLLLLREGVAAEKGVVDVVDEAFRVPPQNG